LLFLAKDGPVIIDALSGETLLSIKDKYNGKVDPVAVIDNQLMFFFNKRIVLVDLKSAKETMSIEGKVEEASSFETFKVAGKTYVFFGFNKSLIAFDEHQHRVDELVTNDRLFPERFRLRQQGFQL
jgi:hypothetical protein